MEKSTFEMPSTIRKAFAAFTENKSCFALPLILVKDSKLQPLSPILQQGPSFQTALNELDNMLTPSNLCYIVVRREGTLSFITYVPYRAKKEERISILEKRHECIRQLGEELFTASIICKEIGEITDVRSWEERDAEARSQHKENSTRDAEYTKNKCRLCDRRMKNKISSEGLEALNLLSAPGMAVQMTVDVLTERLKLNYTKMIPRQEDVAATLPKDKPSFTFYCHPTTQLLYFVFHSPDSASVQERMKHTMAIPGLINVHAQDRGVYVDQKIEVHDLENLVFEAEDERIGKFRSMYLRNRFEGTESTYQNLEADKAFYDAVV